jgi:hypothetical protein
MEKNLLLFFIILFLFSNKIWNFIWDIGKGIVYAIILINILDYLDIPIAKDIKNLVNSFINYDADKIKTLASNVSQIIITKIKTHKNDNNKNANRQLVPDENDNRKFNSNNNNNRRLS